MTAPIFPAAAPETSPPRGAATHGGFTRNIRRAGALLVLLLACQPLWAGLNASLDRTRIQDGETVTLIIEASGGSGDGQPELSVLDDEFEIIGTSTSRQFQFINGQRSDRRAWQIELLPRHAGRIEVPAITLGNDRTRPLQLEVADQPAGEPAGDAREVFLTAVVEPADGKLYVQQQVNYTLRLYFREPLLSGGFDGPNIDSALVERLGEDISYTTRIGGREYQVVERRYAVFPQQSGELVLPQVTFTGQLRADSPGRLPPAGVSSLLDDLMRGMPFANAGKRIRVHSEAQTLNVRPRPQAFSGDTWLPAADIQLHDSWTDEPPEFHAGEPVTRTVRLQARGLVGSQLPALAFTELAGLRLYPEQPQRDSRSDGEWVHGSSSQSVAYVPATSGKLHIPEIRVEWWDTGAQQQRSAVLPAWEVNVLPGMASASGSPPAPQPAPAAADTPAPPQLPDAAPVQAAGWRGSLRHAWPWIAGALVLLAGIVLLVLRLRGPGTRPAAAPAATSVAAAPLASGPSRQAALAGLRQACETGAAPAAARALLQLAEAEWPEDPPRSLAALARRMGAGSEALLQLERVLYAPGESAWDGNALWQALRNGLDAGRSPASGASAGLPPLYPDWDRPRGG